MPAVILIQHIHLFLGKRTTENAELGMSKVKEKNISSISGIEVIFPEDSVV